MRTAARLICNVPEDKEPFPVLRGIVSAQSPPFQVQIKEERYTR